MVIVLLFAPPVFLWLLLRHYKPVRWLCLVWWFFSVMLAALPILLAASNTHTRQILPYAPGTSYRLLENGLHGEGDWPGRDFLVPCGTPLYNPLPNARVVRAGRDNYKGQYGSGNTYILIANETYQMMFLHGRYTVQPGSIAQGARFGSTGNEGNSSECHDHIAVKVNGKIEDITLLLSPDNKKPLMLTWYDPSLGGINCDSDCTTFANGEKVTQADYGRVAACIPQWHGKTVFIRGLGAFECKDKGGSIIEESEFIRVDILAHGPICKECLYQEWEVR